MIFMKHLTNIMKTMPNRILRQMSHNLKKNIVRHKKNLMTKNFSKTKVADVTNL